MENNRSKLLWISFLTLVAAGIGFATRGAAGGAWADEYGISSGQFGGIMGAGFLGFGFVIFFGGIVVEALGYKKVLILAIVLHLISAAMLLITPSLYSGWVESSPDTATDSTVNFLTYSVFLFSICAGLYEAVINPLVGQIYPEDQTHYLNVLHAGWPGGLIVGGIFAYLFQNSDAVISEIPWHIALASFSLVLIYLLMLTLKEEFPATVSEGSDEGMGAAFVCFASAPFLLLIVLHGLIGYMELGVDSWQTRLMENLVENSVIVLIYTSFLMFGLRFFAGPIVHKINPIGLLLISSVLAALGLLALGADTDSVMIIFAAATLYSLGKAFLWPTMLAVAGERYPRSGAVAMGALGASGMIVVGFIGGPAIGVKQAKSTSAHLENADAAVYERYLSEEDGDFYGLISYKQLDSAKQQAALELKYDEEGQVEADSLAKQQTSITESTAIDDAAKAILIDNLAADGKVVQSSYNSGGRRALRLTAYVPAGMTVGFLILLLYYKSIGGYKVLSLADDDSGDDAGGDGAEATGITESAPEAPAAEEIADNTADDVADGGEAEADDGDDEAPAEDTADEDAGEAADDSAEERDD